MVSIRAVFHSNLLCPRVVSIPSHRVSGLNMGMKSGHLMIIKFQSPLIGSVVSIWKKRLPKRLYTPVSIPSHRVSGLNQIYGHFVAVGEGVSIPSHRVSGLNGRMYRSPRWPSRRFNPLSSGQWSQSTLANPLQRRWLILLKTQGYRFLSMFSPPLRSTVPLTSRFCKSAGGALPVFC